MLSDHGVHVAPRNADASSVRQNRAAWRLFLVAGSFGSLTMFLAGRVGLTSPTGDLIEWVGAAAFAAALFPVFGAGPALCAVIWVRLLPTSWLGDESLWGIRPGTARQAPGEITRTR